MGDWTLIYSIYICSISDGNGLNCMVIIIIIIIEKFVKRPNSGPYRKTVMPMALTSFV